MNAADLHAGYQQNEADVHFNVPNDTVYLTFKGNSYKNKGSNGDDEMDMVNHCHAEAEELGIDKLARRKLIIASALCLIFMIGEAIGGALASSLAIMTDAAHLLTDFASFMISLLAIFLASRPATKRMSFGWYRAEVVGALISVLMIWLVTGILVYMAIRRIIDEHYEIDGKVMLITSALGVGVNILMAFTLHQHGHSHGSGGHGHGHGGSSHGHNHLRGGHNDKHMELKKSVSRDVAMSEVQTSPLKLEAGRENTAGRTIDKKIEDVISQTDHSNCLGAASDANFAIPGGLEEISPHESVVANHKAENINVRAAFIHVIGDLLQSVGVMIAAITIYINPHLKIADPICTFLFSVLVLITTINILRDAMNVLMEGTPRGLEFNEVKASLYSVDGVIEVHNLRIWSLTMNKTAVSVHLAIDKMEDAQNILRKASQLLRKRYLIHEVTIQLESYVPEMADCRRCKEPMS